jgi:signal transduction histidine kinase
MVLYSPVPGVTGKSVLEVVKDYPMLMDMVNDMLKGQEGSAEYTFDKIGAWDAGQTRKFAVYYPVRIGNTFWSIAVASAEEDVLSGLISFKNKLSLGIGALFICGIVFSALGAKAWIVLKEEDKRNKLEHELQQKRDELAHITRVSKVGQLASTLAHEVNQPLGAILRNAEAAALLLQDSSPDLDELRAIMGDIRKDGHRAGEVIDRMRAMMNPRKTEKGPLDLNLMVKNTLALVRPSADKRQVQLLLNIEANLPSIHGDEIQLQQVLINLLINALDAVDDNPPRTRRVTIVVRPVGSTVEVAVSDNGLGIAADKIQSIFEPFFSTKPDGLGMGLVISRSIIEAHGGQIWATNNESRGATFTFTLTAGLGGEAS